jgi:AraC-like DNA-binding protein
MYNKLIYKETGRDSMYKIWHYTNLPMIYYSYSDNGSIVFTDTLYPIKRGTLCYIGPRKFHYTMPNDDNYTRSKIFLSTKDFVNFQTSFSTHCPFLARFTADNVVYSIVDEDKIAKVEELFDEINKNADNSAHLNAHYFSALLKLLTYIDEHAVSNAPVPNNFISSAISYINSNLSEKITIDEIAETCHMSKYYFCRRFKKSLGITVMEYILKSRIANAKTMLESTNTPISEISEQCGFSSFSYFSRVFRENTGDTPNAYRKNRINDDFGLPFTKN